MPPEETLKTEATETGTETSRTIFDADLSLGDYERLRRGEAVTKAEAPAKDAKAEGSKSASASDLSNAAQKEAPASDTGATEDEEVEKEEPEKETESKEDSEESEVEAEKPTSKKKGGFQRRISKLVAEKAQAQQEIEYWKQEALKKAQGASGTKESPATDSVQKSSASAAAEGKPKPENFESHADYVEALTDWKTEQKLNERDQKLQKQKLEAEQKTQVATYQERVKAFSKTTPDFAEVLADVDGIPVSATVGQIIVSSDNGPELAYELAKNPDEFQRINRLSPLAAAMELGTLKARLLSKQSPESTETKKLTKAPKPIAPVHAGKGGSVAKTLDDPNLTLAEYTRMRREQMKRRGA